MTVRNGRWREPFSRLAWLALAAIHVPPAAVFVRPGLAQSLYGVAPDGTAGLLVVHRGALFAALCCLCLWSAFDRGVRRAATVCAGLSVAGFLFLYAGAAAPGDTLATIARADIAALLPLGYASLDAWRPRRN